LFFSFSSLINYPLPPHFIIFGRIHLRYAFLKFTRCLVGISDDTNHFGILLAEHPDTYAIAAMLKNGRAGRCSFIELLVGARLEQPNVQGNIFGCGILIDPDNKVANFFTLNGVLLGKFFFEVSKKIGPENKIIQFIIILYIFYSFIV
jgi:hypothetical protein